MQYKTSFRSPLGISEFSTTELHKSQNNSRGTVKGTNKADGDKVIFLELYNFFFNRSIANEICDQQSV